MQLSYFSRWSWLAGLMGLAIILFSVSVLGRPDAVLVDGGRYYGPLVDGQLHGEGRVEWVNGAQYKGEFRDGLKHGEGRMKWADGEIYSGEFEQGMPWGEGILQAANGQIYRGQFVKGELVEGTYIDPAGGHYTGAFKHWQFHGQGTYNDGAGNVYIGTFEEGALNGEGTYTGAQGETYQGEFKDWSYEGQGRMELPNGEVHEGEFRYGLAHGEGTRSYADGREPQTGVWEYGHFAEAPEVDPDSVAASVESILYSQSALLEQSLSRLQATDPDAINLYLLGVGGSGAEEVFRREVEYVRDMFGNHFGTQGRSVALINSRTSYPDIPLATVTSIERSLKAIGDSMDTERDILFLFLTSHGSTDHRLDLSQNGMQLPDMPAARLGKLLHDSGIQWRVVLVSACYSGGFIDSLKNDQTLVITAARHDRTSFGCSDEAEFTYFGRAYFKEALSETDDFQEAFQLAQQRVREWEEEQGFERHSEPQIHVGHRIADHLSEWRASRPGDSE